MLLLSSGWGSGLETSPKPQLLSVTTWGISCFVLFLTNSEELRKAGSKNVLNQRNDALKATHSSTEQRKSGLRILHESPVPHHYNLILWVTNKKSSGMKPPRMMLKIRAPAFLLPSSPSTSALGCSPSPVCLDLSSPLQTALSVFSYKPTPGLNPRSVSPWSFQTNLLDDESSSAELWIVCNYHWHLGNLLPGNVPPPRQV